MCFIHGESINFGAKVLLFFEICKRNEKKCVPRMDSRRINAIKTGIKFFTRKGYDYFRANGRRHDPHEIAGK